MMPWITSYAVVLGLALVTSPTVQEMGWRAFEQNDIAAAHEWANQALAQDTANQRARHLRILTRFLSGQFEDALADYDLLSADYPGRAETLNKVILDAYQHLDRYADAANFARLMDVPEPERTWLDERAAHPPTVTLEGTTIVPFAVDNLLGDLMTAVKIELNGGNWPEMQAAKLVGGPPSSEVGSVSGSKCGSAAKRRTSLEGGSMQLHLPGGLISWPAGQSR